MMWDVMVWIPLAWNWLLWTRQWAFGFYKIWKISSLAEKLDYEGLWSLELILCGLCYDTDCTSDHIASVAGWLANDELARFCQAAVMTYGDTDQEFFGGTEGNHERT
jgi:hypothetical protein